MPNQIPYLSPSRPRPGAVYHWKPSPKLRRMGWTNLKLGSDWSLAVKAAIARNEEVRAAIEAAATSGRAVVPRRPRWRDLVREYLRSPEFTDLKPKSQAEYRSRVRTLTLWAMDGDLLLDHLDRAMILDLRDALVRDGRKHRTAALLRVLRVLLGFAARRGWVADGLATNIDIPEAPSRKRVLTPAEAYRLVDAANASGQPRLALAILLGFWTFQRQGDLLSLRRLSLRRMDDMSARARRVLAGPDGFVNGLRLCQAKTSAWVDIPLPWTLWTILEDELARQSEVERHWGLLLPREGGEGEPWPDWAFQRAFRDLREAVGLGDVQFRDLRRSGMVFFRECGVEIQFITAISGHAVLGRKTILDTYMPGNSRFAAEGMAIAWEAWQARRAEGRHEQHG
jgi:integrase